jgi:hypothetical protein
VHPFFIPSFLPNGQLCARFYFLKVKLLENKKARHETSGRHVLKKKGRGNASFVKNYPNRPEVDAIKKAA